jgi:hypothetical protein
MSEPVAVLLAPAPTSAFASAPEFAPVAVLAEVLVEASVDEPTLPLSTVPLCALPLAPAPLLVPAPELLCA